ncbi:hypothetical protein LTR48_003285 [Friedmanniomyces endolithicus]|uniref:Uncharacterized protein n=1 Tax=Rachicladosporium monterosium TaxID=1507873 RepID=A0ABR0LAI5_9PEZI|nr:hypothetical protein LTR29_018185 [Friedmanniomyces endolithicus]KAK1092967.1 hypothetical protein LTR48_003285 [Friedmanniomyces endolithicus]KAK5145150.1 hypothetical protein LTR32_003044 [Rachicladosporium monterosium]
MAEYTTAGFEVPVVTYAAKDLPPACVENGHHGTRSNAGQETSPEDSVTAGHTGRSHLASPEVPESLSSRDSPSSTKQETVAVDLTNEFCTDKQESPPGIGADHSRIATPARPLTDAAVLASTAGPCDDDKALEDMPKAHDEMTLEASGDAGNESPETVSPQAPDTPVDVPDFAADESPQEVLGPPMPASLQSAPPSPELVSPPQDEPLRDVLTEVSKRDQDGEPLVESPASRSPSPTAMAQGGISSGVPAHMTPQRCKF